MRQLLLLGLIVNLATASISPAQVPDPGVDQDAQAAREKLLKASDELDNIQANSESTKVTLDAMKPQVAALQATITQLQTDNAALKQQLADMQAAFDQYKADQAQARKTLIENVAAMIADASKSSGKSTHKKKETTEASTDSTSAEPTPKPIPQSLLPPPDATSTASPPPAASGTADTDPTPPVKPRKGYYHVVASGETLTMICEAYRENGVNITVSEVRKANGLTADSALKTGQKLFIPKPGT